jgi:hypothetical protein
LSPMTYSVSLKLSLVVISLYITEYNDKQLGHPLRFWHCHAVPKSGACDSRYIE